MQEDESMCMLAVLYQEHPFAYSSAGLKWSDAALAWVHDEINSTAVKTVTLYKNTFYLINFTYFISCNGPCAPKEKWHRKEHIIIIIIKM